MNAERLKTEGRATRESAHQALLAALHNQTPPGQPTSHSSESDASNHTVSVKQEPLCNTSQGVLFDTRSAAEYSMQRRTADDVLLRQHFASPRAASMTELIKGKVRLQQESAI